MFLSKISVGPNAPEEIHVVIENPLGGVPVKYELDKESGMMFVDRFLHTAMYYPGNYGFIPHTLSGDGDPVDVMVIGRTPVMPGAVMVCRPVGVMLMEDNNGQDEKIIAVPVPKLHPYHDNIEDLTDIRPILREQIEHFFAHYKDLEPGKWVKTNGWGDAEMAKKMIVEGIERAKKDKAA
ncbi:inorganic diphosphatase [Micavibrio aeruginosavorus]|jgi:inorganic pyrophosphatase|uniref:Inorganic pyrophosphatase n=2 Tax=Micavibrio aeruginosavorus TaxID=349221 RepID=G2KN67_MICAA|nr:inorganic diphosphatase [Micavibrio aeruginosavorus]AEP09400.1 ppa [Micavibrio aeruginosavorus ARL-13]AGH97855.1 Inorganic pyrophosphatase [Micavibrio aeruginosavorus EPB]